MPTLLTDQTQQPQQPPAKVLEKKKKTSLLTAGDYQKMPEFTPTPEDAKTFQGWQPTGPANAPGMVEPGNIDLTKRPLVHHPDGSVSTLYSGTIHTQKGIVLIPFVSPEGKMLTAQEAVQLYKKTGRHLGIFSDAQAAEAHSNLLHLKQGAFQTWKNRGKYNPSAETYDNWKESQ